MSFYQNSKEITEVWNNFIKPFRLEILFSNNKKLDLLNTLFQPAKKAVLNSGSISFLIEKQMETKEDEEFSFWDSLNGDDLDVHNKIITISYDPISFYSLSIDSDSFDEPREILHYRHYKDDFFCDERYFNGNLKYAADVLSFILQINFLDFKQKAKEIELKEKS